MTGELTAFLPVAAFLVVAALVAGAMIGLSALVGPTSGETADIFRSPYECGIQTKGFQTDTRYPIKFALIAIDFVLFDVELVFFVPWVVAADVYQTSSTIVTFWFVEMLIFFVILVVGYAYILGKDVFAWEH